MDYEMFLRLSKAEQQVCLDAFLSTIFGREAPEAIQHLQECAKCREHYANKFADFMKPALQKPVCKVTS
jgi:hypothetical protein